MLFKDYLRQCRLKSKMSQGNVACDMGYESNQYVSNWERGLTTPSPKVLTVFCEVCEIDRKEMRREYLKHIETVLDKNGIK